MQKKWTDVIQRYHTLTSFAPSLTPQTSNRRKISFFSFNRREFFSGKSNLCTYMQSPDYTSTLEFGTLELAIETALLLVECIS